MLSVCGITSLKTDLLKLFIIVKVKFGSHLTKKGRKHEQAVIITMSIFRYTTKSSTN